MHNSLNSWRVLRGDFFDAEKGQDSPLHSHTCWEWVYFYSGSNPCLHDGEVIHMTPGTFWLTPPGIYHQLFAETAWSIIFILVQGPPDAVMPKVIQDDDIGSLAELCKIIVHETRNDMLHSESVLQHLTNTLLLHVDRAHRTAPLTKNATLIRNAKILWEDHPLLSVEEVAKRLGISVASLRQIFHLEAKMPPINFRNNLRTERATRLLSTSTMKLDAVAELCGFDSASHLSRHIKTATGHTPGKLRIDSSRN